VFIAENDAEERVRARGAREGVKEGQGYRNTFRKIIMNVPDEYD